MPEVASQSSLKRRQLLAGLMKMLVLIGLGFFSYALISSFSSNSLDEKKSSNSRWVMSVPVSELVEGKIKTLAWAGGHAWVYFRTSADIQSLNKPEMILRDARSDKSDQPEALKTRQRSMNPRYFVFIPRENKRNCQVSLLKSDEKGRFTEPCYGAKYDAAGRIMKDSGHHEQQNLAVPEHMIENGILKIGIWMPKI
ncbi:MAG: hypothetical protein OEY78_10210 [Gammaproteobacteria bacterium]|nr:hypothetical protein [Gammaproteobacteria bacterium]